MQILFDIFTQDDISLFLLNHGVVQGTLSDGRVVAVKQLSVASLQGKSQFVAEIATISAVQHCNLVKLYGYCIEGDKQLLVYEYLENKSLDQALFGTLTFLFFFVQNKQSYLSRSGESQFNHYYVTFIDDHTRFTLVFFFFFLH